MNKYFLPVLALLAILLLGACVPVTPGPLSTATAPAATTPEATTPAIAPATVEVVAPTPDTRPTVPAPAADDSRPLAELSPADRNERFSGPAAAYAKPNTIYLATIVTDKGNIVAELYQDTPESLNNFITLALNGFYDGLTFHRVEPGFVIQGGDPAGAGDGGPGYTIPAEINHFHNKGALAWARTSDEVNPERRSSGSQFYITLDQTSFLDGGYTVFGNVIEGLDVTEQIAAGDKIQRIDISEATTSRMPTPAPSATPAPTETPTQTPTPYAPTAKEGRPLATVAVAEREAFYNTAPEMVLDTAKTYQATIETDKGAIVIDLDAKLAPITVNNFVMLANLGFYDGMPVAHVQPETYLVLGSPASQPASDVGYALELEPTANTSQVITGTVSLYPVPDAIGNVVASGSQFFIAFAPIPDSTTPLNIFGVVTEGMDVAQQLAIGDIIKTITISEK